MDDIALFGRSLSDEEVSAIYTAGTGGKDLSQVPPVITVQPRLTIARTAPNVITLSWRSDFTGYVLKSTNRVVQSVSPSPPWPVVVPGVVSNRVSITNPVSPVFYRLEK
jgi:hypothetical protein